MTFRLRKITSLLFCAAVLLLSGVAAAASGVILGDADSDGEVTIIDATCIQRTLAGLPVSGDFSKAASDVDASGEIEITDATYIQRWLADLDTPYPIGVSADDPTQAITEPPTAPPTAPPTQWATDAEGWGHDIYRP